MTEYEHLTLLKLTGQSLRRDRCDVIMALRIAPVVPNRGGIPPQGGTSWEEKFHFIVKLPLLVLHFFFKLILALSISYITSYCVCKLFSGLSHVFVDKL